MLPHSELRASAGRLLTYVCGFPNAPLVLLPHQQRDFTASPNLPFIARQLVIPSDVAPALRVQAIWLERRALMPQDVHRFPAAGHFPVAATAFTETARRRALGLPETVWHREYGDQIGIALVNETAEPVSVTPSLLGVAPFAWEP